MMPKIIGISNPIATGYDGTIDVEIETAEFGRIPFSAKANDIEEYGRDIYARAMAGEFGQIAAPPPETHADIRAKAKVRLRTIETEAIALLLEYVAGRQDAPKGIKDLYAKAQVERGKI